MTSAPLPQPSPYTCPNCGASLTTLPALCPKCHTMVHEFRPSTKRRRPKPLDFLLLIACEALCIGLLFQFARLPHKLSMDLGIATLLLMLVAPIACYLFILRRPLSK